MEASEREIHVRELRARGLSQNAIAQALHISRRTVQRIVQRLGAILVRLRRRSA